MPSDRADDSVVTAEITRSMNQVIDHLVDQIPGVLGALISSADGFVLASRFRVKMSTDAAGLGAMSAAALALSNQLLTSAGDAPASVSHHRSADGHVVIMPIAHVAVLTLIAVPASDVEQLTMVGREATAGLRRLFRGTANV